MSNEFTRVLFWSFDPPGPGHLGVDRQVARLRESLGRGPASLWTRLAVETSPRWDSLPAQLDQHRPDILHISGHGQPDGALVMADQDGRPVGFAAASVVSLIAQRAPKLVVLTACYSRELARALRRHVPCVVGSTGEVAADAAFLFSAVFYDALAVGESVEQAHARAQAAVIGRFPAFGHHLRLERDLKPGAPLPRLFERPQVSAQGEAGPRPPSRAAERAVLLLDAYTGGLSQDELIAEIESSYGFKTTTIFKLSEVMRQAGCPRLVNGQEAQVSFPLLGWAVQRLMDQVSAWRATVSGSVSWFIAGNAPLAVFAHVGREMTDWESETTLLNKRWTGGWDRLELGAPPRSGLAPYFDQQEGLAPGTKIDGEGHVALFVSALGGKRPESVADFLKQRGLSRAGFVDLLHTTPDPASPNRTTPLDADNVAQCADELRAAFSQMDSVYTAAKDVALYIKGPTTLAFLIGRALNPRKFRSVVLTQYDQPQNNYAPAWTLPVTGAREPVVGRAAEDVLARERVLRALIRGVDELRKRLEPADLWIPVSFGLDATQAESLQRRLCDALKGLRIADAPGEEAFTYSPSRGRLSFGVPLLEALRGLDEPTLQRLGPLFVLHELVHGPQELKSASYQGIGRAGVVLEELDLQADSFALGTVLHHGLRRGGIDAADQCDQTLVTLIDAMLGAMAAFDRMEQGEHLFLLQERRLRRYLIWSMQRARAARVREPGHADRLLSGRLFIELAPLQGHVNHRGDKEVASATEATELVFCLLGQLSRIPRLPAGFKAEDLIQSVRQLKLDALHQVMDAVVDINDSLLADWLEPSGMR